MKFSYFSFSWTSLRHVAGSLLAVSSLLFAGGALAQGEAEQAEQAAEEVVQSAEQAASAVSRNVEEQVVTGTIISGALTSVSPILEISGESMLESTTLSMNEFFLVDVTPNQGLNQDEENSGMGGRTRGARGTSVNLRGLGEENTLVLVNGTRTIEYAVPGNDGFRSVDTNLLIPQIAVRRTDILLDGGSGIYGSDAIAGVVNYIPDYQFRGARVNISGNADEGDWNYFDRNIGAMVGFGNDDVSIVLSAEQSYREKAPLDEADASLVNFNPMPGDDEWNNAGIQANTNWFPSILQEVETTTYREPMGDELFENGGIWIPTTFDGRNGPVPGWITEDDVECRISRGALVDTCPFDLTLERGVTTTADTGFIDPFCGRPEEFGLDSIYIGVPTAELSTDGMTAAGVDDFGCWEFQRPARLRQERETDNQIFFGAAQWQVNDRLKLATEVSYGTTDITDWYEYRGRAGGGMGGGGGLGLGGTVAVDGVTDNLGDPSGDFVVEWDHPGVVANSLEWQANCGVNSYCYNGGINPWIEDSYNVYGDPIEAMLLGDYVTGGMSVRDAYTAAYGCTFTRTGQGPNTVFTYNDDCAEALVQEAPDGIQPWDHVVDSYAGLHSLSHTTELFRVGASATYDLSDSWSMLIGGVYATHEVDNLIEDFLPGRLSLALDGLGGPNCNAQTGTPGEGDCYYWNPFMSAALPDAPDNLQNREDVRRWITGPSSTNYKAEFYSYSLSTQGALPIELMGGPVLAAFGVDFRSDTLDVEFDPLSQKGAFNYQDGARYENYEGTTDTLGFIADFNLPITDTLTAQVAGRYEEYSAGGVEFESFNPKLGVNWQTPWEGLTVRASYGTAFRAPTVNHLFGVEGRASTSVDLVVENQALKDLRDASGNANFDPSNGRHVFNNVTQQFKPNPNLEPQTSTAWSLGATWDLTDNLRMTIGYVNIEVEDTIATFDQQQTLQIAECTLGTAEALGIDDEGEGFLYEYYVVNPNAAPDTCYDLDGDGNIVGFNRTYYNVGTEASESLDIGLSYTVMTDYGTFGISPSGTIQLTNTRNTIDTRFNEIDLVGVSTGMGGVGNGFPKYRFNLPISWRYGDHSVTITNRWISGLDTGTVEFDIDDNLVSYTVVDDPTSPDYFSTDLRYNYQITDSMDASFTVSNLTNTQPDGAGASLPADLRRYGFQFNWRYGE